MNGYQVLFSRPIIVASTVVWVSTLVFLAVLIKWGKLDPALLWHALGIFGGWLVGSGIPLIVYLRSGEKGFSWKISPTISVHPPALNGTPDQIDKPS